MASSPKSSHRSSLIGDIVGSTAHRVAGTLLLAWAVPIIAARIFCRYTHQPLDDADMLHRLVVYASALVLAISIFAGCMAIATSSINPSKRRMLAAMGMNAAVSVGVLILAVADWSLLGKDYYDPTRPRFNVMLVAFAGVSYWCFIIPWRADWRAYFAGWDVQPRYDVRPMILLSNISGVAFLAPRFYSHPAVVLCCHLPMLVVQLISNSLSFKVAWLGLKKNKIAFPPLYYVASVLGFVSGFVHLTEMCYLLGIAPSIAAEAHIVYTVLARVMGCCALVLHTVVTLDESGRHKAELATVEERADAIARADEDRQRFMRYVFHELRVPLNSVALGLALVLEEAEDGTQPLPGDTAETLTLLRHSTDTVLSIINDSLDLAKMEAGAMQLALGPVDVRGLVTNSVAQMWPFANGRRTALSATVDGPVPLHILGDTARLSQCLTNFLSNAIKFVAEGTGKVQLRVSVVPREDAVAAAGNGKAGARKGDGTTGSIATSSSVRTTSSNTIATASTSAGKVNRELSTSRLLPEEAAMQPDLLNSLAAAGFSLARAAPAGVDGVPPTPSSVETSSQVSYTSRTTASASIKTSGSGKQPGAAQLSIATLRFAVVDNGVGIDKHELGLLYQPFVQVEAGVRQKGKGTGLGLAIVRQIVQSHGGAVSVESEIGVGSTFSFTIPCVVLRQETTGDGPSVEQVGSELQLGGDGHGAMGVAALRRYVGEGGGTAAGQTQSQGAIKPTVAVGAGPVTQGSSSALVRPAEMTSRAPALGRGHSQGQNHAAGSARQMISVVSVPADGPSHHVGRSHTGGVETVPSGPNARPGWESRVAFFQSASASMASMHHLPLSTSMTGSILGQSMMRLGSNLGHGGLGSARTPSPVVWRPTAAMPLAPGMVASASPSIGSVLSPQSQLGALVSPQSSYYGSGPVATVDTFHRSGSLISERSGIIRPTPVVTTGTAIGTTATAGRMDTSPDGPRNYTFRTATGRVSSRTGHTVSTIGDDGLSVASGALMIPAGVALQEHGEAVDLHSSGIIIHEQHSCVIKAGSGSHVSDVEPGMRGHAALAPYLQASPWDVPGTASASTSPVPMQAMLLVAAAPDLPPPPTLVVQGLDGLDGCLAIPNGLATHRTADSDGQMVPSHSQFHYREVYGNRGLDQLQSPRQGSMMSRSPRAAEKVQVLSAPVPAPAPALLPAPAPVPEPASFVPLRWLFVDDIESNRRFLARLLMRRFPLCTVFDGCEDGEQALSMCRRVAVAAVEDDSSDVRPPEPTPGHPCAVSTSPREEVPVNGNRSSTKATATTTATAADPVGPWRPGVMWPSPFICSEWTYDVICMDGSMPVLDGYEATRRLRAAGYPGLILGVTGNALEADRRAFLDAGVDAVVPKPVRPQDIMDHVTRRYGQLAEACGRTA